MLWTIAVVLAVLWLLGLVSSYTMGGFIHILLVLAIIVDPDQCDPGQASAVTGDVVAAAGRPAGRRPRERT